MSLTTAPLLIPPAAQAPVPTPPTVLSCCLPVKITTPAFGEQASRRVQARGCRNLPRARTEHRCLAKSLSERARAAAGYRNPRSGAGEHGHIVPRPAAEVLVRWTILARDCGAERATWRRCRDSLNPCGVDVELHSGHCAGRDEGVGQVRREGAHAARVQEVSAGVDAHRAAGHEGASAERRSPDTDVAHSRA